MQGLPLKLQRIVCSYAVIACEFCHPLSSRVEDGAEISRCNISTRSIPLGAVICNTGVTYDPSQA